MWLLLLIVKSYLARWVTDEATYLLKSGKVRGRGSPSESVKHENVGNLQLRQADMELLWKMAEVFPLSGAMQLN